MKSHNLGIVFPPSLIYASFHVSETAFVNPSSHAASLDVEMVDRFPFLRSQQAVGSQLGSLSMPQFIFSVSGE